MGKVFFSIVIPIYNAEKYISTALQSVKDQSESDYELILINNGSTDGSDTAIDIFIKENPEMRIKKIAFVENQGPAGARNAGIEEAAGKYVCFLDADDYWYSNKLERIKKIIQNNEQMDVFWHWEDQVAGSSKKTAKYRKVNNGNSYLDLLYNGNCLSPSATVIRTSLIKEQHGFRTDLVSGEEDYDCWLRLAREGAKFCLLEEALGVTLIHPGNFSANYKKHFPGVIRMLNTHFVYLEEHSDNPNKIKKDWQHVKARYLCSMGRRLSVSGERKDAMNAYKQALHADAFYLKTYAGILLHLLHA